MKKSLFTNLDIMLTKQRILLGVLILLSQIMAAKVNGQNSHLDKVPKSILGLYDTLFDNIGHKYLVEDLMFEEVNQNYIIGQKSLIKLNCINTNYFDIYFESNSGFEDYNNLSSSNYAQHLARANVLCQVLNDISNFIPSPLTSNGNGNKVKIWIRDPATFTPPPSFLAFASSFYAVPYNSTVSTNFISDNQIQKTIISGIDAYTNVFFPIVANGGGTNTTGVNVFHGIIAVNFSSSINWNTNLSNTPSVNEYDLYSVLLHEIIHSLGFSSLIDYNGNSKLGANYPYYSRYDKYLETQSGQHLINSSGNCLSGYNFQPSLSVLSPGGSCLHPNPNHTDNTFCSNAIKYHSSNVSQFVYTPTCYEEGSTLSHFEDQCLNPSQNNSYFTMSDVVPKAVNKRFPQDDERLVLCDLGYSTANSYGSTTNLNYKAYTTSCNGFKTIGVNDGISGTSYIYTCSTPTMALPIFNGTNGILDNDYFAIGTNALNGFECLNVVMGTGSVNISSGTTTSSLIYTAPTGGYIGLELLSYIPVDANGNKGNITYVYIYVIGSSTCTPSICNLVTNGNFEQYLLPYPMIPTQFAASQQLNKYVCGWGIANQATADYFNVNCPSGSMVGIPCNFAGSELTSFTTTTNFGYVGMATGTDFTRTPPVTIGNECMFSQLSSPLLSNTNYTLKFDLSLAEHSNADGVPISVFIAPTFSFNFANGRNIIFTPGGLILNPTSTQIVNNKNGWTTITFNFNTGSLTGLKYITIGNFNGTPANNAIPATTCGSYPAHPSGFTYYYIDNIELNESSITPVVTQPMQFCSSIGSINLNNYVTPNLPGGVFSCPSIPSAISQVGLNYFLNTTLLSSGSTPLIYTYTNANGCVATTFFNVDINSFPNAFTFNQSSPTICLGNSVSLGITGSTSSAFTWAPSPGLNTTTGTTVIANPTVTTTYIVTSSSACGTAVTNSIVVTVNAPPVITATAIQSNICTGMSTNLQVNQVAGYAYSWSSMPIGFSSSFTNISVSPSVSTTYFITATSTIGCQSNSSVIVNVSASNCCVPPQPPIGSGKQPTLVFNNIDMVTLAAYFSANVPSANWVIPGGATINYLQNYNGKICFNGTFTINQNVEFRNCPDIVFGPNATIILNSSFHFYITSSHLYSCDGINMWNGIQVLNGGNLVLGLPIYSTSPTIIEDAKIAVENYGSISFSDVIFRRNYIGIKMNPNSYLGYVSSPTFLLGPTFDGANSNGTFTNLLSPYSNLKKSYCGIIADGITQLNIGSQSNLFGVTTFKNLVTGIVATNSNLKVVKCQFQNISGASGAPNFPCAIRSYDVLPNTGTAGSHTVQIGAISGNVSNLLTNTFTNCDTAIFVMKQFADIGYNQINQCRRGIIARHNEYKNINIHHNTITNPIVGISIEYTLMNKYPSITGQTTFSSGKVNVFSNIINQDGGNPSRFTYYIPKPNNAYYVYMPPQIGIRHIDFAIPKTYQNLYATHWVEINDNYLNHPTRGIELSTTVQDNVHDNQIALPQTLGVFGTSVKAEGIRVENATNVNINCNYVAAQSQQLKTTGIYFYLAQSLAAKYNNLYDLKRGIIANGASSKMHYYYNNTFSQCDTGLVKANNASPGNQGYDPTNRANWNQWMDNNNNWYDGQSHWHTSTWKITNANIPPSNIYYDQNTPNNQKFINTFNADDGSPQAFFSNIRNAVLSSSATPVLPSICNSQNFRTLSTLFSEYPEWADYYRRVAQDSVYYGEYPEANRWTDQNELMNAIAVDSTLLQDSIFNNFAQQNNSNVQQILMDIQQQMVNIVSDSTMIDTVQLNSLWQFNNSLQTETICDVNVQTVNGIKLKYTLQGKEQMAENDKMDLENVASQCVFSGCPAVLEARGIMEMIGIYQYDDEEICGEQYAYRHAKPKTSQPKTDIAKAKDLFAVFPNPALQKVYISYVGNATKNEISIVDLMGRTVSSQMIEGKNNIVQFDVTNIAAGVYVVLLKENGQVKQNKRLCVVK